MIPCTGATIRHGATSCYRAAMDTAPLLHRPLADVTWVAFDTEATGYSNVTGRLVEIAGVKFRLRPGATEPGEGALAPIDELDTFEELVNPGVPIPAEVIAIHGIDDAAVAGADPVLPVLERFLAFCDGAVLIAHYVPFDLGAMTFALVRAGRGVPRVAALDTSILPKRLFPGAPNYALPTLVKFLGLPAMDAHRAMPDARSTRDLFRRAVAAMGDPAQVTVGEVTKLAGPLLTFDQFSEIPHALPGELAVLGEAMVLEADLMLEYRGGSMGHVPRKVTPSHLFAREGALFLEGYCHLSEAAKSFRIDRIQKATLLPVDPAAPVFRNKGSGHWLAEPRVPS
ncbi:MAG: exonuclease domain-containing protein [Candidatus Eisenbacteria bacterium]